jgi:hypothetical protein
MPRPILREEWHLTFFVPPGLDEATYDAISPALNEARFQAALRRAVRAVVRRHLSLRRVRVRLPR